MNTTFHNHTFEHILTYQIGDMPFHRDKEV